MEGPLWWHLSNVLFSPYPLIVRPRPPLIAPLCFCPRVLQNALLLSDSCLHLFLQSHLSSEDIEACVSGQTKYSVEDAIHKFALMNRRFPEEDEEGKKENDIDYDSERYFLAFRRDAYVFV